MSNREILYIEDNFHNRRIVRKILERQGYTLHEREDGLEGYEFLKELKPGVVLLDISLPSMDGMEIARRVKKDPEVQHIYLIALTASAMQGDRERFLDAGCDDYLSKPFRALDLVELVNKYADLVATNVPAPPPQPSEMHDTGPLEVKKAEASPEPVEMEPEVQAEPEVEAVVEQEIVEPPQIEEAVEAAVEPATEHAIPAASEPAAVAEIEEELPPIAEIEEPETEPVEPVMDEVELPAAATDVTAPVVEAVEALDETPAESAGVVEEAPEVAEPVVPANVESVDEAAAVEETPAVEEIEAAVEQAAPLMEETTAVEAPAVEEKIQTAGLDQESIEAGLKKLEEKSAEPIESGEMEAEVQTEPEAVVEQEIVAAPQIEEAVEPAIEREVPAAPEPAAAVEAEEELPTIAEIEETVAEPAKPVMDEVACQQEEEEPEDLPVIAEQSDTEEPAAKIEIEEEPSSPAMVEDLSKKNGNLGSNNQKNTEEIDAIKAGIMGVINPDNLRPVDPNNHRE